MIEDLLDNTQNMESGEITPNMKESMRGTAPWMKFLGVLFMVLGGIYGIFALIALFASPGAGIIALAVTALYIYMGYLMFKSGSDYSSFVNTSNTSTLESSLKNQKNYWMIMGILMIVALVISFGAIIFGVTLGSQLSNFR